MREQAEAAVLAAFAGDALSLGVHWIFDPGRIAREFGRVDRYRRAPAGSYHAWAERGALTPCGDQMLALLDAVAAAGGFDLGEFARHWRRAMRDYPGYLDTACRGTLANLERGADPAAAGTPSNDLCGAARMAPLVLRYRADLEALVRAVRSQTRLTHTDPGTVRAGEFFAEVTWNVLQGGTPVRALQEAFRDSPTDPLLSHAVEAGLTSMTEDSSQAIGRFGRDGQTPHVLPGVVHLIARYEGDLREALVQAVMAGGDSATRAALVGTVLGAHLGPDAIPAEWLTGLKPIAAIRNLMARIP